MQGGFDKYPSPGQYQAASAYDKAARQNIANPRHLEGQALLKAARQLDEIKQNWDAQKNHLDTALTFNRKLWTIFVSEMEKDHTGLDAALRRNITNLGVFVFEKTVDIIAAPEPAKLAVLIAINQNLAAGLLHDAQDSNEPEPDPQMPPSAGKIEFEA